ncbi:TNF receptor-associated factor family protein DDB_G0290965 isoform X1 [Phoenix dactylifera]|uniref:TNF receptor-associated factor family protein DDB_G0290965 isoform X1 n=1 Tax=Phoenix dactylifera TaxID=42345 RepID=A0A8B9B1I5_PHODC|nr:TNF receptor-associated factor family protein DDB_G0290965 isoform X1 [Phoenix dactylifera]
MDLPVSDTGPVKEGGSLLSCNQFDIELVHQIAKLLLPGLATACVDNTTGLFKGPASVAVEMRKEMVDYLTQRSETYLAESAVRGDGNLDPMEETSKDPTEIISNFINDFTNSKRNMFSRVSGWLMSESREDKIDDFVQEMDKNGFWLMDRRKAIAETLLRNLDFRNMFHCPIKFDTAQQLAEHRSQCCFRPVNCTNVGCKATFSAIHTEKHDSVCPFKVLPCEQNCPENIVRREMDRHCVTVCPMKLVNCPFYQVGCQSAIPQCTLEQHCSEFIHSHLLYVLQMVHKQEISVEEVKQRVQLLEKSQSLSEFSETLDVRSLTLALKEQEAKIKKLESELSKSQSAIKGEEAKMKKLESQLSKVRQSTSPA